MPFRLTPPRLPPDKNGCRRPGESVPKARKEFQRKESHSAFYPCLCKYPGLQESDILKCAECVFRSRRSAEFASRLSPQFTELVPVGDAYPPWRRILQVRLLSKFSRFARHPAA